MLPLAHATVGYLSAIARSLILDRQAVGEGEVLAVLFGTQLPDIVDKPLSYVGVLQSGRSFAHSLLVAVSGFALATRLSSGESRRLLGFVALGYVSHLVADTYRPALAGRWWELGCLAWPLIPAREYAADDIAPWTRLARAYQSEDAWSELAFAAVAVAAGVVYGRLAR